MQDKPTVFQKIISNDVSYSQPFKAYKNYRTNHLIGSASGYATQSGVHSEIRLDIGVPSITYPTNNDGSNQHVIWKSLNHKFYKDLSYDYTEHSTVKKCFQSEHFLNPKTEKRLFYSASTIAIPYHEVGERIKPGSVIASSSIGDVSTTLYDDGEGNLYDPLINSSSFASSSKEIFYLTFNDEYKRFRNLSR